MRVDEFDYRLPAELIAERPPQERGASRMLVIDRATGRMEHWHSRDLARFLSAGDVVVLNDAKVIPARLPLSNPAGGELLLLEQIGERRWICLARPARRLRKGAEAATRTGLRGCVVGEGDLGERTVEFEREPDLSAEGEIPLPPYISRGAEPGDVERYQTVYATVPGAVAAPTAGLHIDRTMLDNLPHVFITLLVGVGTFRDVKVELVKDHTMHAERYRIGPSAAARINHAARRLAVGTTVARTLEATAVARGRVQAGEGRATIFIYPPYKFQVVDMLMTNFHLPRSTLLMMVSAFAGRELVRAVYEEAIRERYRFYSYGDCMLIL